MSYPRSFGGARVLFEARAKTRARGIKLANHTYLAWETDPGDITVAWFGVRLHSTMVVTFLPDGRTVLDTGGWKTVTTRDRINRALPPGWHVESDRGVWSLHHSGDPAGKVSCTCYGHGHVVCDATPGHATYEGWGWDSETDAPRREQKVRAVRWTVPAADAEATRCPRCGAKPDYAGPPVRSWAFADGITIRPDGTVTGEGEDPAAQVKLRKRARTFAADYVDALYAGEISEPGPGDCFGCYFRAQGTDGNPRGPFGGPDHMLSHLEERYFVPSLVLRALERFGGSQAGKHTVACLLSGQRDRIGPLGGVVREQILRAVRRHVCEQLD
jgi:hypothetical protein